MPDLDKNTSPTQRPDGATTSGPQVDGNQDRAVQHLQGPPAEGQVEVKTEEVKKLCSNTCTLAGQAQGPGESNFAGFVKGRLQREKLNHTDFGKFLHIERELIISGWLREANGSLNNFKQIIERVQKETSALFNDKTVKDEHGKDVPLLDRVNTLQSRYLQSRDKSERERISMEITKIYDSLTEDERQSLLKYRAATVALERLKQLNEVTNQSVELKARLPAEGHELKLGEQEYTLKKENWDEEMMKITLAYLVTTTVLEIENIVGASGGANQVRRIIDHKSRFQKDVIDQLKVAIEKAGNKTETQGNNAQQPGIPGSRI